MRQTERGGEGARGRRLGRFFSPLLPVAPSPHLYEGDASRRLYSDCGKTHAVED